MENHKNLEFGMGFWDAAVSDVVAEKLGGTNKYTWRIILNGNLVHTRADGRGMF